jgi:hypothetical protein
MRPALHAIDEEKIKGVYAELRRESASGGVHSAVRHIESIIRMSEASARMHLRASVRSDDVDLAISVLLKSVIACQKYAPPISHLSSLISHPISHLPSPVSHPRSPILSPIPSPVHLPSHPSGTPSRARCSASLAVTSPRSRT